MNIYRVEKEELVKEMFWVEVERIYGDQVKLEYVRYHIVVQVMIVRYVFLSSM